MLGTNSKKGQISINLTGSGVFAIVIIVIFLFLIGIIAYILYLENQEYEEQFEHGTSSLNNLSISTIYQNPEKGSTKGLISASINSSSSVDGIIIILTYKARNFDKTQDLILYNGKGDRLENPHNYPFQPVDTLEVYSQLGNEAIVCTSILAEYQKINWIGRFFGKPKKTLESCKNIKTIFE